MGMIYYKDKPYAVGNNGSGASDTDHVELTYAEFQALSEEEQNNGTVYFITDLNNDGSVTGYTAGIGIEIDENKEISVSDVRKNYIDNSDFSINQTGATEYTEAGYTVDRWYIDGGSVTVSDRGIVFTNPLTEGLVRLRQDIRYPFEHFAGKTLTLSVKIDGVVHYSSGIIPAEKPTTGSESGGDTTATQYITYGNSSFGINLNYSITGDYFVPYIALVYGQTINVEWMKLEIGEKPTPYVEPDHKTELIKINSMNSKGEISDLTAAGIEDRLDTAESKISTIESNLTGSYIQQTGGTIDIETGVVTETAVITLTRGVWYVSVNVRWDTGSGEGIRSLILTPSSTQTSEGSSSHQGDMMRVVGTMPGINRNYITHIQNGIIRVTTSEQNYHLYIFQNSGKTLTSAYNMIGAYKLKGI